MIFSLEKEISEHLWASQNSETHTIKKQDTNKHGPARAIALRELE